MLKPSQDSAAAAKSPMLAATKAPRSRPAKMPTVAMAIPCSKNSLSTSRSSAPIVRRMAISARLSSTSMDWPETMLKPATATTSSRIRNISAFSIFTAAKSSP